MLRQRIITAVVLAPLLIAALFLLPAFGIALLFGVFVAVGAWEWGALSGLSPRRRLSYVALILALGAIVLAGADNRAMLHAVFGIATVWWLVAPFEMRRGGRGVFYSTIPQLIAGLVTLLPAWAAIAALRTLDAQPPWLLLFVLVLVGVADTAAYAAGHAVGRTKLAPSISPGKTVEGVIGGVVAVMLLAYFCGTMLWRYEGAALAIWIGLATTAGLVSVIGDLSESKLKRVAGVKDSGTVLPGHGGVLDRIDALTAAAPVFAWGWLIFFDASS